MMMFFDRFGKGLLLGTALALVAQPAWAQQAQPSTNAMVNLIELLTKQGVITKENGAALIAQAEAEADRARQGAMTAPAAMPGVKRELIPQEGFAGAEPTAQPPAPAQTAEAPPAPLPPAPAGTLRVPYVPAVVRNQIRDEVKKEVLADIQKYGWAQPNLVPDWVKGVTISGDIRFRNQSELYSDRNTDGLTGLPTAIIDFNRFNEDGPTDARAVGQGQLIPYLINTRRDRISRLRLRARLGVEASISENVSAGLRLATGDDNGPISTNQILGGGLSKKDIWLDQAWLKLSAGEWGSTTFGRFANPFYSTPLLFDEDLNFDGVSATLVAPSVLGDNGEIALTAGAFPLEFGSSDFPSNQFVKSGDQSKWLFSGQLRAKYEDEGGFKVLAAAAYHSFKGVEGKLSAPCPAYISGTLCSTDQTRPQFLRKGNSLFFLRDVTDDPTTPAQNDPQPQFVGLVFDYDILDINAAVAMPIGEGMEATLYGNYLRNLSFKRSEVCRYAPKGNIVNNFTTSESGDQNPCSPGTDPARFNGGNEGWIVGAMIGHKKPKKWGEWNVFGNYRRLETDAVLDTYTDSDFHLGGTNSQGYVIGGNVGLFDGLTVGARWLSANEISGPPLSIDVFQFDLSAEF